MLKVFHVFTAITVEIENSINTTLGCMLCLTINKDIIRVDNNHAIHPLGHIFDDCDIYHSKIKGANLQ